MEMAGSQLKETGDQIERAQAVSDEPQHAVELPGSDRKAARRAIVLMDMGRSAKF
jgi:hypothetical protein